MSKFYNKKKTRLLITGLSGFLGRKILNHIDKKKFHITSIGRKKIPGVKNIFVKNFFELESDKYEKILNNIDIVLHLAWYVEHGKFYNSYKNFECLNGSIKFVKACQNKKIKKFVGIGTGAEYKQKNQPFSVNDKLDGQSIYAQTKISLFKFSKFIFNQSKIKFSWCRIFYLYGEGEPKTKLITSVRTAIKKKKKFRVLCSDQKIDFIEVNHAAKQIVITLDTRNFSESINICSGKGITIKKFLQNYFGKKIVSKYIKFNKSKISKNYIGIKSSVY